MEAQGTSFIRHIQRDALFNETKHGVGKTTLCSQMHQSGTIPCSQMNIGLESLYQIFNHWSLAIFRGHMERSFFIFV